MFSTRPTTALNTTPMAKACQGADLGVSHPSGAGTPPSANVDCHRHKLGAVPPSLYGYGACRWHISIIPDSALRFLQPYLQVCTGILG